MYVTYVIWRKHMRKFWQSAEELVGIALQSVLWVVLFSVGMRGITPQVQGQDYLAFALPGIIALTAMSGAVGGGIVLLDERVRGIIKEYLVAPISRLSILAGNAASTATKALVQAVIILLVGLLMGVRLSGNPLGWAEGVIALALFALGFSGIALAVAAQSRSIMGYHGMIFLFNLPLLFASNALYPTSVLPSWMQAVVMANPATYLIDLLRSLAFNTPAAISPLLSFGVMLLLALVGLGLALLSFTRAVRRGSVML